MKRWLGPDLNGWHDFAARDWPPEEPDALAQSTKMLDGGLESLSVSRATSPTRVVAYGHPRLPRQVHPGLFPMGLEPDAAYSSRPCWRNELAVTLEWCLNQREK
jgi:hypothetical protein